jgi:hypothetical protein
MPGEMHRQSRCIADLANLPSRPPKRSIRATMPTKAKKPLKKQTKTAKKTAKKTVAKKVVKKAIAKQPAAAMRGCCCCR